ncbi:Crp/Fnr family transcriptional regulator [Granulicella sp. dw_53]|uniref:Crp/Fnr family transcriptional regulator n=1 Tax=Granulicella sp. dw_53 TaxID=2719792 RepID=UPI001BD3FD86|nr:Crp/Fnr family transcriptional regulator [Granulicella sp. dw_53]
MDALRELDRLGEQVTYVEGDRVVEEGAAAERVCVVCKGTLKLTTSSRDGRLLLLRIAGPGDVLGLASALKGTIYESTAEALEECEVRVMDREDFLRFMEEFRGVGLNSAETVAREYGTAVTSARRLALSGSAAGRLASVLLDWGRTRAGRAAAEAGDVEGPLRFRMPLTHEELGHMAGISRETATRALTKMKAEGLIEIEGERIVLPSPEKLERLYC